MRTVKQLREWVCAEIVDVMDCYDNTENEARQHIQDMIEEDQDSYSDVSDEERPIVLRLLRAGAKAGSK